MAAPVVAVPKKAPQALLQLLEMNSMRACLPAAEVAAAGAAEVVLVSVARAVAAVLALMVHVVAAV